MKDRRAEFPDMWHAVLQRTALTIDQPIGYVYDQLTFSFEPLREVVASLLYVDVVSVLEAAVRTQMNRDTFDKLKDLENRLAYLQEQGKLIDHAGLEKLRLRRNNIAHAIVRVEQAELHRAIDLVQAQLQAWRLVRPAPCYEFYAEKSQSRDASDEERSQGARSVDDYKVRVTLDGRPVIEYTSSRLFG